MLDILPIGYRIIVKPKEVPEKVGSIFVPNNTKELEPTEGTVVAIGDEVEKVKVGDMIYYGKYAGFRFNRNKTDYVFLNEEDVLGIITGGNDE